MPRGDRVFGVDFDNTVADYDGLFHALALRQGWIGEGILRSKRAVRDFLRTSTGGDERWRRLQTLAYGPEISGASVREGAPEFFRACRERAVPVYIVSHKTEFAACDGSRVALRSCALEWMRERGFFDPQGLGLTPSHVVFEPTRPAKVERIRALGCTHFIDDLEETFLEASFPETVDRILLDPEGQSPRLPGIRTVRSWKQVHDDLLGLESRI